MCLLLQPPIGCSQTVLRGNRPLEKSLICKLRAVLRHHWHFYCLTASQPLYKQHQQYAIDSGKPYTESCLSRSGCIKATMHTDTPGAAGLSV